MEPFQKRPAVSRVFPALVVLCALPGLVWPSAGNAQELGRLALNAPRHHAPAAEVRLRIAHEPVSIPAPASVRASPADGPAPADGAESPSDLLRPTGAIATAAMPRAPVVPEAEPSSSIEAPSSERQVDALASDLAALTGFLPGGLHRDLVRLTRGAQKVENHLFGRAGIVSVGRLDGAEEVGRVRLNLQHDPNPGLRLTLVLP